jgi:hypothetical protein
MKSSQNHLMVGLAMLSATFVFLWISYSPYHGPFKERHVINANIKDAVLHMIQVDGKATFTNISSIGTNSPHYSAAVTLKQAYGDTADAVRFFPEFSIFLRSKNSTGEHIPIIAIPSEEYPGEKMVVYSDGFCWPYSDTGIDEMVRKVKERLLSTESK